MKLRRRDEVDSDGSKGDDLDRPPKKRSKVGGVQLGSVFVNVDGLDSDREADSGDSPRKPSRPAPNMIQGGEAEPAPQEVHSAQDREDAVRGRRRSAEAVPGSTSVYFRGVSYNATTDEVQEYLAQCGECPVRAVRWPNERGRNCG
jgi:hypothetical protein